MKEKKRRVDDYRVALGALVGAAVRVAVLQPASVARSKEEADRFTEFYAALDAARAVLRAWKGEQCAVYEEGDELVEATREVEEGAGRVPLAVWSGEVMGVPVHVLDDGRRIVDVEGLTAALERIGAGTLDAGAFAAAYNAWMRGG